MMRIAQLDASDVASEHVTDVGFDFGSLFGLASRGVERLDATLDGRRLLLRQRRRLLLQRVISDVLALCGTCTSTCSV